VRATDPDLALVFGALRLLSRLDELRFTAHAGRQGTPGLAKALTDQLTPFAARVCDAVIGHLSLRTRDASPELRDRYAPLQEADRARVAVRVAVRVAREFLGLDPQVQGDRVALEALRGATAAALRG
jgi:hypothetical protein